MPLNPIRGSNYSRMHPAGAGIRRSPREKRKGTKKAFSYSLEAEVAFFFYLCAVSVSVSGAVFGTWRQPQQREGPAVSADGKDDNPL